MGFPIGDLFSLRSFILADVQTCQLFENDLMATSGQNKQILILYRGSDLLSILILNPILLKRR